MRSGAERSHHGLFSRHLPSLPLPSAREGESRPAAPPGGGDGTCPRVSQCGWISQPLDKCLQKVGHVATYRWRGSMLLDRYSERHGETAACRSRCRRRPMMYRGGGTGVTCGVGIQMTLAARDSYNDSGRRRISRLQNERIYNTNYKTPV